MSTSNTDDSTKEDPRCGELLEQMNETKKKWDAEALDSEDGPDETDALLSKAIEAAIAQGKGWKDGEREAYMAKYFDDDYLDPLFATTQEELEKSGMTEAFSSIVYDEPPSQLMIAFKKKGNTAFMNGKKNRAKNVQYYRDAINHYYEAFMWAERVEPGVAPTDEHGITLDDTVYYTESELDEYKSTLCANAAMAHIQLRNWGHCKDDSNKALIFNDKNLKAWFRLAKGHQMLHNWEEAVDAIDSGLACDGENKDLIELQNLLEKRIRRSRLDRQKRERARAERVSKVKEIWKYCRENGVQLGRIPLVSTVTDDEENDDGDDEARWHHHHPHTGCLPHTSSGEKKWPCMFVYPSHNQSDFIEHFGESDMLALQMAEIFPEIEQDETTMPWDYNNEFVCSKLAIYFEVHCTEADDELIHPECVELLKQQGDAMRFYESSRALKGDEGADMANLARLVERKHLYKQRKAWKKKHGSLWAKPNACPVVRVHPGGTLRQVLTDKRMVVPNFMVTFVLFPEEHPAHKEYLKEHKCLGIIEPEQ